MPSVTKEQLNTEFAKKICKPYKEGTSAGVKTTPSKLIDPNKAETLAMILVLGFSFEKKLAALNKYIKAATI